MCKWFYLNKAVIGPCYQKTMESRMLKTKYTSSSDPLALQCIVHLLYVPYKFSLCLYPIKKEMFFQILIQQSTKHQTSKTQNLTKTSNTLQK